MPFAPVHYVGPAKYGLNGDRSPGCLPGKSHSQSQRQGDTLKHEKTRAAVEIPGQRQKGPLPPIRAHGRPPVVPKDRLAVQEGAAQMFRGGGRRTLVARGPEKVLRNRAIPAWRRVASHFPPGTTDSGTARLGTAPQDLWVSTASRASHVRSPKRSLHGDYCGGPSFGAKRINRACWASTYGEDRGHDSECPG